MSKSLILSLWDLGRWRGPYFRPLGTSPPPRERLTEAPRGTGPSNHPHRFLGWVRKAPALGPSAAVFSTPSVVFELLIDIRDYCVFTAGVWTQVEKGQVGTPRRTAGSQSCLSPGPGLCLCTWDSAGEKDTNRLGQGREKSESESIWLSPVGCSPCSGQPGRASLLPLLPLVLCSKADTSLALSAPPAQILPNELFPFHRSSGNRNTSRPISNECTSVSGRLAQSLFHPVSIPPCFPQIRDPEEAHTFLHPLGNVRERRAGAMPVSGTPFWTLGKADVAELVGAVAVMGVSWSVWAGARFQRRERYFPKTHA